MRIDINLATRPYEDVGRFYRTWGLLVGSVGLVTLVLAALTISSLVSAHTVGRQTAKLQVQIAALDKQRKAAEDLLNRPENRETRDRSRFLNELIARKAFSWTEVFADLEKIMPAHVRVLTITPGITEDNQIKVAMRTEADTREKNIELVRRMNESKTFRQAEVKSENAQAAALNNKATVQFDIVALYTPKVPLAPESKQGGHGGAR